MLFNLKNVVLSKHTSELKKYVIIIFIISVYRLKNFLESMNSLNQRFQLIKLCLTWIQSRKKNITNTSLISSNNFCDDDKNNVYQQKLSFFQFKSEKNDQDSSPSSDNDHDDKDNDNMNNFSSTSLV